MKCATLNHARIVMDGNSITAGNNYGDPNDTLGKQILYQLQRKRVRGLTLSEFAVGGQTCTQMINDASQTIGASFDRQRNNFIIVNEGGNDITFGATPGQAFDNLRNYCLLRRSEGYYVLVWDCLFRNNSPSGFYTAVAYKQALVNFNNLVKNNWKGFADGYLDARKALPYVPLNDYTGVLNGGFWFPDCVHPSATATGILASKLIQVLEKIPEKIIKVDPMAVTFRFTSAGSFSGVVPPNVSRVRVICKGADSGGGSGRKGVAGTGRSGGCGGSAGAKNDVDFPLSVLGMVAGNPFSGVVGAPGIGGAAVSANSTNGNNGTNGGASWAVRGASGTDYLVYSLGGNLGAGGLSGASGGGSVVAGMFPSITGGSSSVSGNSGSVTGVYKTNGSGAAGGGISTANAAFAGGTGGRGNSDVDPLRNLTGLGGAATGVAGGNGGFPATNAVYRDGGGGGGASLTGNAGDGGIPSGGGGASVDGVGNSGKGGDGLPGQVIVIFY